MEMVKTSFKGRDWIDTQEWDIEELETILEVAVDLKKKFATGEPHRFLEGKTLFMLFYNPSLRTRNSFEAGMTQLGGHAHYLTPEMMYTPGLDEIGLKDVELAKNVRESIDDTAKVLSRYGDAIAIRIFQEAVGWYYGRGNKIIREYAQAASIPVINMEDDMYHPCQAMADLLTAREKMGKLEGKKVVLSWAYSPHDRTIGVHQSNALLFTRFGADVVVSHPQGFEFDPSIVEKCKKNAAESGGSFEILYDMDEAFEGADIIVPKSWMSLKFLPPQAPKPELESARAYASKFKDWKVNQEKLDLCDKRVIYMHCLPADRGYEVTDDVIDGPHSVVFDEAENRLHVQKAIMCLIMGGRP
jgi:N-acetylornithine carbamoyltransferase